jgi:hypothetical protein
VAVADDAGGACGQQGVEFLAQGFQISDLAVDSVAMGTGLAIHFSAGAVAVVDHVRKLTNLVYRETERAGGG